MKTKILVPILFCIFFLNMIGSVTVQHIVASPLDPKIINQIDLEKIRNDVQKFTGFGSRLTGYPGYEAAAEYIYDVFNQIPLENVTYDKYYVTVPVDHGANITVLSTGELIKAHPIWPNMVETCSTPPEGIEGLLIYAGKGDLSEYHNSVNGSIVLIDFDSLGTDWIRCIDFGAKAVIFMESQTTYSIALQKILDPPVYFPRLYVSKEDGEHLLSLLKQGPIRVRLKSSMTWEKIEARNVLGIIRGSERPQEVVILSAYFDSFSIIPSVPSGAEDANGISILLELARFFSKPDNMPKITVLFLALSGHHQAIAGSREFMYKRLNDVGKTLKLMVSLNLNSKGDTLGLMGPSQGGYFPQTDIYTAAEMGPYDTKLDGYLQEIERQIGDVKCENLIRYTLYNPIFSTLILNGRLFMFDSEALMMAGSAGLSFVTLPIENQYYGTPFDTFDKINFANLKPQIELSFLLLHMLVHDQLPDISGGNRWATLTGDVVYYDLDKGWYTEVPNALVYLIVPRRSPLIPPYTIVEYADSNGTYTVHGVFTWQQGRQNWAVVTFSYVINAFLPSTYGPVTYGPDYGKYGNVYSHTILISKSVEFARTAVFECGSILLSSLFTYDDPVIPGGGLVWGGHMRATPILETYMFRSRPPDFIGMMIVPPLAVLYAQPDITIEMIEKSMTETEPFAVLINATKEKPDGFGYRIRRGKQIHIGSLQIALDLYFLDETRIRKTELWGVENVKAKETHEKVRSLIQEAIEAIAGPRPNYVTFTSNIFSSLSLERSVYIEIKSTMKDTIGASSFFLLLLIPFFLLLQGLLRTTKRLKGWTTTVGIVVAMFLIFIFLHPAFIMISNVYVSLLAFLVAVFLIPGIALVWSHFSSLLKELTLKMKGVHLAEISRISAFLSAISIGIENMRRRKFRTVLSLLTVTVVVFSLISFTSMSAMTITKFNEFQQQTTYNGIIMRGAEYIPLFDYVIDSLKGYEPQATVSKRASRVSTAAGGAFGVLVTAYSAGGKTYGFSGLMGLSPSENEITGLSRALINGIWFTDYSAYQCIISSEAAEALNVHVLERIIFFGYNFTVVGIFNATLYQSIVDVDNLFVSPIFYFEGQAKPCPAAFIVIVPFKVAKELGSPTYSVVVKFNDPNIVFKEAEDIHNIYPNALIVAGSKQKAIYMTKLQAITLYGWQQLIIPFILTSLTIISTMLGAVYERTREVATYSAVGLSPLHVAGMFLAESLLYSTLGGVLGYTCGLIGSMTLRYFQLLPPEFIPNLTSSWVVMAIGIGMLSTLVPTLYPAFKASKMVTPSAERKWKISTKPVGDEWEIPIPFRIGEEEVDAVFLYLEEYFRSFMTARAENFSVEEMEISEHADEETIVRELKTTVRLAPYEAGVHQKVTLIAPLKRGEKSYSFSIHITRITGIMYNWIKMNRKFIDSVRKQILIWRSLRGEERDRYLKMAKEASKK